MNHETKQIWKALQIPKSGENLIRADSPSVLRIPGEEDFVFSSDRHQDLERICELHNADDYTDEQILDWLAGQALAGWAAGRNNGDASWNRSEGSSEPSFVAESCYRYADAMMAERKKRQDSQSENQPMQPS